jgi:hypothetical protein
MANKYTILPGGKPLEGHESAQAQVVTRDGISALISYNTVVAQLDSEGWLTVNALYSMTTRKHIGWFLKEYCNGTWFSVVRDVCVKDHMRYNIHTGEVQSI